MEKVKAPFYARYGKIGRPPLADGTGRNFVGIPAERVSEFKEFNLERLEIMARESTPPGYEFLGIEEGDISGNDQSLV